MEIDVSGLRGMVGRSGLSGMGVRAMSKIIDLLRHRAQSRASLFLCGDQLVEVSDHIERLEASVIHLGNEIRIHSASNIAELVQSEVCDFFATFDGPGGPEDAAEAQQRLQARLSAILGADHAKD